MFDWRRPTNLGVKDGRLARCRRSPNCVSSQADPTDKEHYIAPIHGTMEAVRAAVNDPQFQKAMTNVNTPIQYLDAPAFQAFVKSDGERLASVVRKMGKTQ